MNPNKKTIPLDTKTITQKIESGMLLPALSGKIIQSMLDEDIDVFVLAKQMVQEQSIVVRTLRVANSPFYGLARKVDHLESAIIILGFRTIRNIAFGVSLTRAFSFPKTRYFDPHAFWQHSIAVAVAARHLALLKKENAELAFTAGLLHEIGRLALARVFPEDYAQMAQFALEHDVPLLHVENQRFPFNHATLGAQLAKSWNLPERFVLIIENVDHPSAQNADVLTDIVHVARAIACALSLGEKNTFVPLMDESAWNRLQFEKESLLKAFSFIIRDYADLVLALLE